MTQLRPRSPAEPERPVTGRPDVGHGGLADVAERLMAEFEGNLEFQVVSGVVGEAARDLAGTGAGAWQELLERSARQRLLDLHVDAGRIAGGPAALR